jgi:aspartate kinase
MSHQVSEATQLAGEPTPVVMKFGGSSVADLDRLRAVAEKIVARAEQTPVVVVVSAMGKTTNDLVATARELCPSPPSRELDMLLSTGERQSMSLMAMAIAAHGSDVVSLTGSQCGIITDHRHGQARIMEVRPFRIWDELADGRIVIVGGFQGVSYRRDVTTIGRGGSDTTAVALAAALGGDCEIYSDVDGVYSADPREIPEATRIDEIGYEEMQALSRAGARVLHAQAVQLAQDRGIAIYARRTDGSGGETVVRKNPRSAPGVHAVTSDPAVMSIRIAVGAGWLCTPSAARTFSELALMYTAIDGAGLRGVASVSRRTDRDQVLATVGALATEVEAHEVQVQESLALVSCVGAGLEERADVLVQALDALEAAGLSPVGLFTDANTLAFLVPSADRPRTLETLHSALVPS